MPKISRPKTRKSRQPATSPHIANVKKKCSTRNGNSNINQYNASLGGTRKPPTARQRYQKLAHEAKCLNIVFHHEKFSSSLQQESKVPHCEKFEHIQILGRLKFDSYGPQPSPDTVDKPWQLMNKNKAARLSEAAAKCKKEELNEEGWRERIEYRLFERFEIEVACKRCRKRLWQSEIQADPSTGNSVTNSLRERQSERERCKCDSALALNDVVDHGLSDMFTTRIGETNFLEYDDADFDPTKKKPDRIHGLQTTEFLQGILNQQLDMASQHSPYCPKTLQHTLQTSCNPNSTKKQLHCPFLVMEAKRSKKRPGFRRIEIQTALPIRNMLKLQHELQVSCGKMPIPGGPLVWFLANQGADWRVYGCYMTTMEHSNQPIWNIIRLWEGCIISQDGALQLVLIIDYILDWARDIYRPSIVRQLMSIAGVEARSLYTITQDPDNLSAWARGQDNHTVVPIGTATANYIDDMHNANSLNNTEAEVQEQHEKLLHNSKHGVVSCGRVLNSRIRGLCITADNVMTMLQGCEGRYGLHRFINKILDVVAQKGQSFVLPNTQALKAIEEMWTGVTAYSPTFSNTIGRTIVSVHTRFWLSKDWHFTRELNYLAITEEAYKILCEKFWGEEFCERYWDVTKDENAALQPQAESSTDNFQPYFTKAFSIAKSVSEDEFVSMVYENNDVSKNEILRRCTQGQAFFLHDSNMDFKRNNALKIKRGRLGELVTSVYRKYKNGTREPDEAFLRHMSMTRDIRSKVENESSDLDDDETLVYDTKQRRFCLFVAPREQETFTLDWLVRTLASKFTSKADLFMTRKTKANNPRVCLGSDPELRLEMANWIISIQPSDAHLKQMKREFPDEALFNALIEYSKIPHNLFGRAKYGKKIMKAYIKCHVESSGG
ncbi:hypothetical protein DM02DRAFT_671842 [Periconia macrospinosa]|uniref:Uncharacterized protein n=1 Tax=Periconia macrospinosa TaxID=97972 RepID=A0A2V1DTQ1_9PLEO|nr:hypothetical protein DM02DRAFT_671842 [Periconia macrospinosa]